MKRVMIVLSSTDLGGSESLGLSLAAALGDDAMVVFMSDLEGSSGRFGSIRAIAKVVRQHRPETVLAFMFGAHLWVALGARLGGARKMLAFVGNPAPLDLVRRERTRWAARASLPFVTAVVACSDYVAASIRAGYGLPKKKVVRIWNWCSVDKISVRTAERSHRGEGKVVGMIARLDPIKDHELLLRSFALVHLADPTVVLRVVGDGPLRPRLEGLASELGIDEAVVFVGAVQDPITELTTFDVFAFCTTVDEGFGVVLAEAMAARTPIVATDVGPVRETLADGRGGSLVPPGDPVALAEEIGRVLGDPEARARMASDAFGLVVERYDVDRAVDDIEKVIG
jgi:glycosyltransferase involved in cell wall biosynthesis